MEKFISSFNYVIEPSWRSLKSPDLSVPSKSSFHRFKSFSGLMKSEEVTSCCTRLYIQRNSVSTAGPDVQPQAPENSFCSDKTGKCSTPGFMINGFVALSQRPSEWVIAATASPYYKSHCTPSHIVKAHHVGVCFCITYCSWLIRSDNAMPYGIVVQSYKSRLWDFCAALWLTPPNSLLLQVFHLTRLWQFPVAITDTFR